MTRFAVVYQDTRAEHDYYEPDSPRTVKVDVLEEFDSEEDLLKWITRNNESSFSRKSFRAFRLEELVVEQHVTLKLTTK